MTMTHKLERLALITVGVVIAACTSPPSARPTGHGNGVAQSNRSALLAEADELLSESRRLDFRAPMENTRTTALDAAIRKLMEACLAGEPSACWRAHATGGWAVATIPFRHQAAVAVGEHCIAGDRPSCVALESGFGNTLIDFVPSLADEQLDGCALGDKTACAQSSSAIQCLLVAAPPGSCDSLLATASPATSIALVKDLCHRGLGAACRLLAWKGAELQLSTEQVAEYERQACRFQEPIGCELAARRAGSGADHADRAYWEVRRDETRRRSCADGDAYACESADDPAAETVAERACRAGLVDVCRLAHSAKGLEQICATGGDECEQLAKLRAGSGLPERDALEHGCQFFGVDQCARLVDGYEQREWPEPVAGRAEDLERMVCQGPPPSDAAWHDRHCVKRTGDGTAAAGESR